MSTLQRGRSTVYMSIMNSYGYLTGRVERKSCIKDVPGIEYAF